MERKPKLLKSSKVVDSSGKHETKMKVENLEKESVQDVSIFSATLDSSARQLIFQPAQASNFDRKEVTMKKSVKPRKAEWKARSQMIDLGDSSLGPCDIFSGTNEKDIKLEFPLETYLRAVVRQ
mgnify:CR=1 FL=1